MYSWFSRSACAGFGLLSLSLISGSSFAQSPDPFAENVRSTAPLAAEAQQKTFTLPEGFEIQLFAADPDIAKPMNMAFDARGRLWITETVEYPFPKGAGQTGRDRIRVLEDTDNDGRADKISTFAEGLNIPIGLYPYNSGVIAYSIPNISFYDDTDGDGKADKVEVLYSGFGSRDTHGMTNSFRRGFDGWLYATHGFNNESNITSRDGKSSIRLTSGNVYRMRVDGTKVEHYAWGPVNPFGATFDSLGNFFISDCHSWPLINVLRGAWYPHFGNPHDGLGFGPKMMDHSHHSTGLDAACLYEAMQFPEEFRGNLFVGNVVTSRVNRDALVDHGSTRIAQEKPDFLTTADPWFRPNDIQLGPDGALYISDFYNRIIGHYEVPLDHPGRDRQRGRIWRIIYKGADHAMVELAGKSVAELVEALGHANIKVRFLAADQLADVVAPAQRQELLARLATAIAQRKNADQAVHALWLLHRLGALDPALLASAARDKDAKVRVHAMRLLAEQEKLSDAQREMLIAALKDENALVQRCAADALGVHVDAKQTRALLEALAATPAADTHLHHTLRMALRNTFRSLPGSITALPVDELNAAQRARLSTLAAAVNTPQAAGFLMMELRRGMESGTAPAPNAAVVRQIARYAEADQIEPLVGVLKKADADRLPRRLANAQALAEGLSQRGMAFPESLREWSAETVVKLLAAKPRDAKQLTNFQRGAAELARVMKLASVQDELSSLLADRAADAAARGAAARVLIELNAPKHVPAVARLVNDGTEAMPVRDAAATALGEAKTPGARALQLSSLPQSPRLIQVRLALGLASTVEGAEMLLKAVESKAVSPRLLMEPFVAARLKATNPPDWEQRVATLTRGQSPVSEELQKLMDQRRNQFKPEEASVEAGALVFSKNCIVCHSVDGQGGNLAPQLDGIGARGLERLIEDLLDPNRNVDPAFYQSTLTLKGNDFYDGLFRREEGETLVFADATGKETAFNKADIRKRVDSNRSLMPDNFHEVLTEEEFNHLLAFLMTKNAVKE